MSWKPGSRRSFIKKTAGVATGFTLGSVGSISVGSLPVQAAPDEPSEKWGESTYEDAAGSNPYRLTLSHGLGWYGAYSTNDGWRHDFRVESKTGSVIKNASDDPINQIRQHESAIDTSGGYRTAADVDDGYFGVTPAPDDTGVNQSKYAEAAIEIAKFAISLYKSYAAAAFTAAEVINLLRDEAHVGYEPGYKHIDRYVYDSGAPSEADHFRRYAFWVEESTSASWYSRSDSEWGVDNSSPFCDVFLNLYGSAMPSGSTTLSTLESDSDIKNLRRTDEDTMMFEYDGSTLERIPVTKLQHRGRQLGLSETELETLLDKNEPLYFAHSVPMERSEPSR